MEKKFSTPEQLAQYLMLKHPRVKFYQDGRLNYGEGTMRWHAYYEKYVHSLYAECEFGLITTAGISATVEEILRELIVKRDSKGMDPTMAHLVPLIDFEDSNKKILFNSKTHRPSSMDIDTYKTICGFTPKYTLALLQFDPYDSEYFSDIEVEGIPVKKINLYSRPPWQERSGLLTPEQAEGLTLPPLVEEYFAHLFPEEECRDFVLDWMHFCLVSRCETYLILNGAKGAGKGAFFEAIMTPLIGKAYCNVAPESGLEANFNSFLDGKRLVFLDEVKFNTPAKVSKLKRYINADQNIEKKGVDADKTVRTFNSFIVANNDETDATIEWDDRRFSVMDITKIKLEDVWTKKKINKLYALSDEEVEQMGNYIFHRKLKVMDSPFSVWRGAHFWKLCYVSLPEWGKVIVDMVTSKEKDAYSTLDLRREYKKRTEMGKFPRPSKIQDFLSNYKHEGEFYLGTLHIDGPDFEIVPSDTFKPKTNTELKGYDAL